MKAKRIFTILTAILMFVCCMAVSASAGETFQDEYVSLQVPDNYKAEDMAMTGALTKGAYYETNADGEETGDNFNFYILKNNVTHMTIKTMQKDAVRQEMKQQILDSIQQEGKASGVFYDIQNAEDSFEIAEHFSYYKVSLSANITYRGVSAPMYQVLVLVPVNDCTFYFTYTSMDSMEKAESECAAMLDNIQILIEPKDNGIWVVVIVVGAAIIGGLIGVVQNIKRKKKKAAAQQQAAYPYPTAPNGQYPANGQYPNVPPQYPPYAPNGNVSQSQPQNPQQYTQPTQTPSDSQNTQNF